MHRLKVNMTSEKREKERENESEKEDGLHAEK